MWADGDGTVCVLIEREQAPRFEICVRRGGDILGQHRLFARPTAQMVADAWRRTFSGHS
jgi:hypothetical protein